MAKAKLTDAQLIALQQATFKELLEEQTVRELRASKKPIREFVGSTARTGVKVMRLIEDQLDELLEEGLEDKIDRRIELAVKYGTA